MVEDRTEPYTQQKLTINLKDQKNNIERVLYVVFERICESILGKTASVLKTNIGILLWSGTEEVMRLFVRARKCEKI